MMLALPLYCTHHHHTPSPTMHCQCVGVFESIPCVLTDTCTSCEACLLYSHWILHYIPPFILLLGPGGTQFDSSIYYTAECKGLKLAVSGTISSFQESWEGFWSGDCVLNSRWAPVLQLSSGGPEQLCCVRETFLAWISSYRVQQY